MEREGGLDDLLALVGDLGAEVAQVVPEEGRVDRAEALLVRARARVRVRVRVRIGVE